MVDPLELDIRQELTRYLSGEETLHAFQAWFIPRAWEVERSPDIGVKKLAHEINLALAEYTNGHRTVDELERLLLPLAETYRGVSDIQTSSSSVTIFSPLRSLVSEWVGIRPETVSG